MAYITNSTFGTTPSLEVVDIATGQTREVLAGHYSTAIQEGYVAFLEGEARAYHKDNVTLKYVIVRQICCGLYWTPTTGTDIAMNELTEDFIRDYCLYLRNEVRAGTIIRVDILHTVETHRHRSPL